MSAFRVGVAANHLDLLLQVVELLAGHATPSSVSYTGTGDGDLVELRATPAGVTETWTITCTAAATNGGTFSVVGSVSGAQADAGVGIPYENSFISFLIRDGATDFQVGDEFSFTTTIGAMGASERWDVLRYTGVDQIAASSELVNYEAWTAFKGPYHNHANGWSTAAALQTPSWLSWRLVQPLDLGRIVLRGSATISESPRDFALQWSDDGVQWTTRASWSAISWAANEEKEFAIGGASPGAKRYWRLYITANNGSTSYTRVMRVGLPEFILTANFDHARRPAAWLRAPGMTGYGPVFINFQIYDRPTNDYYNLAVTGATGFVGASNFDNQPGALAAKGFPLWNQPIPFWIAASGQGVVIGARVDSVYMVACLGKALTFGMPGQYPYPLVVGAPLATATAVRYSDASVGCPLKGNSTRLHLRSTDGSWKTPYAWPYTQPSGTPKTHRDTNGSYPLLPITLYDTANTYGILEHVAFVTGFNNAVENTVPIGAETWTCLQDANRNGLSDFFAMRTE